MTEREKWEAGLWYDANFDEELRIEREKAEELYTEFNQTRPSQKEKRAELLRKLLLRRGGRCGRSCRISTRTTATTASSRATHVISTTGPTWVDCANITIGQHCFIGPGCGMYTAIHPILPQERNSGMELCKPITLGDNVWLGGDVTILPGVTIGSQIRSSGPGAWW